MTSPCQTPKTILLVEDQDCIRETFKQILEMEGYHVILAYHGKHALDILSRGPLPSLILLDLMMPIMNGWEFLQQYKDLDIKQKARVVIMILSTSSNPDDIKKAKEIKEVTGFETKPLNVEVMTEILNQHFKDYL